MKGSNYLANCVGEVLEVFRLSDYLDETERKKHRNEMKSYIRSHVRLLARIKIYHVSYS
jgi:hypothetical protein